jgi:branched-chain amino acid transport system substrate-binding protein
MKFAKVLKIILLVTLMVASLWGCAPKQETGPIRIGAIWSLTGEFSIAGVPGSNALGLAIKKINEEGGVLGRQIEVVTVDAKGDQNETINAMKRLIYEEKVPAVVGLEGGVYVTASAPIAQEAKIPFLISIGTSAELTEPGEYIFMTAFGDDYQGKVLANYVAKKMGAKTAVVMTDQADPYSSGLSKYFMDAFKELNGEASIISQEMYNSGDVDFSAQLTRIKALDPQPDILAILSNPVEAPLIAKQARDLGITAQFVGGDGVDSLDLVNLGGSAVEGMVYSSHFFATHLTNPVAEDFVKRWTTAYGTQPSGWEALGYDTGLVIAEAIRLAGVVEPEAIRKALLSIDGFQGVTGTYRYVTSRTPTKPVVFVTVKNGERVFLEEYTP